MTVSCIYVRQSLMVRLCHSVQYIHEARATRDSLATRHVNKLDRMIPCNLTHTRSMTRCAGFSRLRHEYYVMARFLEKYLTMEYLTNSINCLIFISSHAVPNNTCTERTVCWSFLHWIEDFCFSCAMDYSQAKSIEYKRTNNTKAKIKNKIFMKRVRSYENQFGLGLRRIEGIIKCVFS